METSTPFRTVEARQCSNKQELHKKHSGEKLSDVVGFSDKCERTPHPNPNMRGTTWTYSWSCWSPSSSSESTIISTWLLFNQQLNLLEEKKKTGISSVCKIAGFFIASPHPKCASWVNNLGTNYSTTQRVIRQMMGKTCSFLESVAWNWATFGNAISCSMNDHPNFFLKCALNDHMQSPSSTPQFFLY